MNIKKVIKGMVLCAVVFLLNTAGVFAGEADAERAAQLEPMENLTAISVVEPPTAADGSVNGNLRSFAASYLPEKYDTRGTIASTVKNQKPYGMCWAFTTAAGIETSLLKKGESLYDLSEAHLAYFFANRRNDPLGNTSGDKNVVSGDWREGGNQVLASIFLTTWSGMALESQMAYPTDESHTARYTATPSATLAYSASAYLTDAAFAAYSVNRVKTLIYEYGAVGLSLMVDSNYYNTETYGYCYPIEGDGANHAVTLVGWNDDYPASNFASSSGVSTDGAWIAKNSWGTSWGDGGYFYISYQNKSNYNLVAESAQTSVSYQNNYFYDGSCAFSSMDLLKTGSTAGATSIANVFRATAGNGNAEALGEVVLATNSDGNRFSIQIYTDLTDANDPTSGKAAYSSPVEYYQTYAGISTVSVPEVTLTQNSLYSVVISNIGSSGVKYLCETESVYDWVSFEVGLDKGQSFAWNSINGWSDLYNSDMCMRIKAHTRTLDAPVVTETPKSSESSDSASSETLGVPKVSVKVSSSGYNKVSWNSISGAQGYAVYRRLAGKSWSRLATLSGSGQVSYTDKKISTATVYEYAVRAYRTVSGKTVYGGYKSSGKYKSAAAVQRIRSISKSKRGFRIQWKAQKRCDGYFVYRKMGSGSWKRIATLKSGKKSVYFDNSVKNGKKYTYAVRAFVRVPYGIVSSRYVTAKAVRQ